MKLAKYEGKPAIFFRWRTKKPQAGDHMNVLQDRQDGSGKKIIRRMVLVEPLHSQPCWHDANMTEEYWSYVEVSERDFARMRHKAATNKAISETHDKLF